MPAINGILNGSSAAVGVISITLNPTCITKQRAIFFVKPIYFDFGKARPAGITVAMIANLP